MFTRTLVSRAILLRSLKNVSVAKQATRNSGHGTWSYRVPPPYPSRKAIILAEVLGAIAWWWIFWHCFTEPDHIYGEFEYIDPSTYSDEELGIPPDCDGSLK